MNFIKSIEFLWSLIATNVILTIIIVILISLLIKRKKSYLFFQKKIKKPFVEFNIALRKSMTSNLPHTPEAMTIYHMSDFNHDDLTDDPYSNTALFSNEQKKKFCEEKIKEIRNRTVEYFQYTNCRIKPKDLNELEIYKRELSKL